METVSNIFTMLSNFIIPIIIFYLLWTIFNIIRDYRKYGNKIFSAFKKYEGTGNLKDIIINILEQESTSKPFVVSKNANTFIVLTEKEIYGIVVIDFDGKLSGKINDEYLKIENKEKKFLNPLCPFTKDLKKLKTKNIIIHPLVIKGNKNVELFIDGLPSNLVMNIKDFSYYIYKSQNLDNKYSTSDLKKYIKTVEKVVNDNN